MEAYKYYNYSPNGLLAIDFLENGEFLFSDILTFNDRYEGNWIYLNDELTLTELDIERKRLQKYAATITTLIDSKMVEQFNAIIPADRIDPINFPGMFPDETKILYDEECNKKRILNRIEKLGVFCLSKTNTNQLLWCHYANNEKGICISFELNHPFFSSSFFKVRYSAIRPSAKKLILNQRLSDEDIELFIKGSIITKGLSWKYEKEIRVVKESYDLIQKNSKYFGCVPIEAITSITLGSQTPPVTRNEIYKRLVLDKKLRHIELFEVLRGNKNYNYSVYKLK